MAGANLREVLRSQHSPGRFEWRRERQIIFIGGVVPSLIAAPWLSSSRQAQPSAIDFMLANSRFPLRLVQCVSERAGNMIDASICQ
jgi:hypothetical protein